MKNNIIKSQDGIAIILAMVMLLVMSVMAVTVSFISNVDFKMMAVHKRGQESFLAAETCVAEARQRLETVGVETLFFQLQSTPDVTVLSTSSDMVIIKPINNSDDPANDPEDWKGSMCRSGPRIWDQPTQGPARFIELPPPSKAVGRPLKNVSLASGGSGGAALVPITFEVMGKNSVDEDKNDDDPVINTGTELAIGFESFIPGGATNMYSGQ